MADAFQVNQAILVARHYCSQFPITLQAKYQHHLVGDIVATLAYDFMEFTVSGDVHGCPLEVTLVYADLTATSPSTVEVTCNGTYMSGQILVFNPLAGDVH